MDVEGFFAQAVSGTRGDILHRGLSVTVPGEDLVEAHRRGGMDQVHRHVADQVTADRGIGRHWTSDLAVARKFSGGIHGSMNNQQPQTVIDSYGDVHVPVVVHGKIEPQHHSTDSDDLAWNMVQGHGWNPLNPDSHPESETLVHDRAPVAVSHIEASLPIAPNWMHQVRRHLDTYGEQGDLSGHQHAWRQIAGPGQHTASVDEPEGCYYYPGHEHEHEDLYGDGPECPYENQHTDWDHHYPRLGQTLHRGVSIALHADAHDESKPMHERAQAVLRSIQDKHRGLGTHWTTNKDVAHDYATRPGYGEQDPSPVIVHAHTPERHHIEEDPDSLAEQGTFGYEQHDDEEVPIHSGAPVRVHGVSWLKGHDHPDLSHPDNWNHHTFDEPQQHTASRSEDIDALGRTEHPHVDDYRSGGIGHRSDDPDRSVVGFLPTKLVRSYREHGGDWNGQHSKDTVAAIRSDIESGTGITSPVMMEYDHDLGWGYVGEGNHRVEAAHQAGAKTVPVRVYGRARLDAKKKQGIGGPMTMNSDFADQGAGPDYVPPDVHPHHFTYPGGATHAYDYTSPQWRGHEAVRRTAADHPFGKQGAVLDDWTPTERLFAPTKGGVDPRLFDEQRKMLPKVRLAVLTEVSDFFHQHGWTTSPATVRVYLAGSQASEWYGNNDFDLLIGINDGPFQLANPQFAGKSAVEVGAVINTAFRDDFNDEQWHPPFDPEHEWHRTGYVNKNSWDIRQIKPYAAYNVTDDTWAVEPIHAPEGHQFDTTMRYYCEGVTVQVRHALALPEPYRTLQCSRIWTFIHSDRSRAFGPHGSGAFDRGNVLEKWLDQVPSETPGVSLMAALADAKFGRQATGARLEDLGPEPQYDPDQEYEVNRDRHHAWKKGIRRGLSLGHIGPEEARAAGYSGTGHDQLSIGGLAWQPLPKTLYHVSTHGPQVRAHGLKSRDELGQERGLGLGGGESDTVSFTDDEQTAHQIHDSLREFHGVLHGAKSVRQMYDEAKAGTGAKEPYHGLLGSIEGYTGEKDDHRLNAHAKGHEYSQEFRHTEEMKPKGWEPMGEPLHTTTDGKVYHGHWSRPATEQEKQARLAAVYSTYASAREYAGGKMHPGYFQSDVHGFAQMDPSHFEVLKYHPRPGAQGYRVGALGEWRTATGDAVTLDTGHTAAKQPSDVETRHTRELEIHLVEHHPDLVGHPQADLMHRAAHQQAGDAAFGGGQDSLFTHEHTHLVDPALSKRVRLSRDASFEDFFHAAQRKQAFGQDEDGEHLASRTAAPHPAAQQDWYHGGILHGGRTLYDKSPRHPNNWLHVGTRDAAAQRIDPRGWDIRGEQDWVQHARLHKVRLVPGVSVCPTIHEETGKADSEDAGSFSFRPSCGDYDAHRYRNAHEDEGSISLAVRPHKVKVTEDLGRHQSWSDPDFAAQFEQGSREESAWARGKHATRGLASAMLDLHRKTAAKAQSIEVAGVALKAEDTGRVLLLQRSNDDQDDPARGTWEFPGGHLEDGEDPFTGAKREWCEETGATFPEDAPVVANWISNGMYQGFVVMIGAEADLDINLDHEDRTVLNPDDPDGDGIEVVAWWEVEHLPDNPAVRQEVRDGTDWDLLEDASLSSDDAKTRKAAQKFAVLMKVATDSSYRMTHQGPSENEGSPMHALDDGHSFPVYRDQGESVYTHMHYYTNGMTSNQTINAIHRVRNRPEASVTMYRAVPHGVTDINKGDWVTPSSAYARAHAAKSDPRDDWPVLKAQVQAQHLRNDGNDLEEWSYHGPDLPNAAVHHPGGQRGQDRYRRSQPDYWRQKVDEGLQVYQAHPVTLPPSVHAVVHDQDRPRRERIDALAEHLRAHPIGGGNGVNPSWFEDHDTALEKAKEKAAPGQTIVHLRATPTAEQIHSGENGEVWLRGGTTVSKDRLDAYDHRGKNKVWGYASEPLHHRIGARTEEPR